MYSRGFEKLHLTTVSCSGKFAEPGEEDRAAGAPPPYRTADEFVERAVVLLHEQERWLAQHAAEIGAKAGEGYAAAKRGERIDAERVRAAMEEKKRAWLADQRS